jgi:pantetheine-phosphate adenylyltransferase
VEERLDILRQIFKNEKNVEFDTFEGLLVDYAKKQGASTLIRGIRTISDYEYELQMSIANHTMEPGVDTIFLMPESRYSHISSSIIKEIIKLGGSCKGMIHPFVESRMKKKLLQEKLS